MDRRGRRRRRTAPPTEEDTPSAAWFDRPLEVLLVKGGVVVYLYGRRNPRWLAPHGKDRCRILRFATSNARGTFAGC